MSLINFSVNSFEKREWKPLHVPNLWERKKSVLHIQTGCSCGFVIYDIIMLKYVPPRLNLLSGFPKPLKQSQDLGPMWQYDTLHTINYLCILNCPYFIVTGSLCTVLLVCCWPQISSTLLGITFQPIFINNTDNFLSIIQLCLVLVPGWDWPCIKIFKKNFSTSLLEYLEIIWCLFWY